MNKLDAAVVKLCKKIIDRVGPVANNTPPNIQSERLYLTKFVAEVDLPYVEWSMAQNHEMQASLVDIIKDKLAQEQAEELIKLAAHNATVHFEIDTARGVVRFFSTLYVQTTEST